MPVEVVLYYLVSGLSPRLLVSLARALVLSPPCASVPPSPFACDCAKLRAVTLSPIECQVPQMKTA